MTGAGAIIPAYDTNPSTDDGRAPPSFSPPHLLHVERGVVHFSSLIKSYNFEHVSSGTGHTAYKP